MHLLLSVKDRDSIFKVLEHYAVIKESGEHLKSILVVDLHDDQVLREFCQSNAVGYEPFYREEFNKSVALNLGINRLYAEYPSEQVLVCDADVTLDHHLLSDIAQCEAPIILDEVQESEDGSVRKAFGMIKCFLKGLVEVGGYDSEFNGWGFEDHDIIWRLENIGYKFKRLGRGTHISHSDEKRVRHYYSDNLSGMRLKNKGYYESKVKNKILSGTLNSDIALTSHER